MFLNGGEIKKKDIKKKIRSFILLSVVLWYKMASNDDGFKPSVYNDDATRLREVMEIYSFLEAGNKNDIQSYKDWMAYYTGTGQWTDAERTLLESEGRPPLTFNFIFAKVNTVAGLEQQIRSGFKVYPTGA